MRTLLYLSAFQAILSAVAEYLISKMSFFGKMGISLFYKEYKILKSPVETGLAIFFVEMAVVVLLFVFWRFVSKRSTNILAMVLLLIAVIGLAYTIYDFTYEFSHKILKSKFHIGFYLIWIGIMISCIVYMIKPARFKTSSNTTSF